MSMLSILLQESAASAANGWSGIIMMVLIFVVFYFFLIRPQNKRQKEIRKFQDSLAAGKRVITSGGIYGKIKDVKDDVVVLEVADNVRIKVSKSMVFDSPENAQQQAQQPEAPKDDNAKKDNK
ncbi:MAG: preprotein translocase subunit YajC [Paludibacteraceae bacterium]